MVAVPAFLRPVATEAARSPGAESTSWPLFGPACATALLAGTTGCLLLPALPPTWLLVLLLVASIALTVRRDARRLLGVLLLGAALAGLHAHHALDLQLPPALERQARGDERLGFHHGGDLAGRQVRVLQTLAQAQGGIEIHGKNDFAGKFLGDVFKHGKTLGVEFGTVFIGSGLEVGFGHGGSWGAGVLSRSGGAG